MLCIIGIMRSQIKISSLVRRLWYLARRQSPIRTLDEIAALRKVDAKAIGDDIAHYDTRVAAQNGDLAKLALEQKLVDELATRAITSRAWNDPYRFYPRAVPLVAAAGVEIDLAPVFLQANLSPGLLAGTGGGATSYLDAAATAGLRTRAGLQAHLSDDTIRMADACGRLVYVVAHAARQHNLQDTPEARILAGTANALADIVAAPGSLEQHRASVLSGLSACERLLPQLHTWALALGAQELDGILGTRDFTTGDVRAALGVGS